MDNSPTITWGAFKNSLSAYADKHLNFRYSENRLIAPSYHITEIKLAPITSVDCGGKINRWTEVIVQLWEPEGKSEEHPMKVSKALSIVDMVQKALPLDEEAFVKIEFGNSKFDARQMYPGRLIEEADSIIVDLVPDFTQCKALGRGGSCGTIEDGDECCTAETKPKVELKTLPVSASCCEPGSGCC